MAEDQGLGGAADAKLSNGPGFPGSHESPGQYLERAVDSFTTGDYRRALHLLREALKRGRLSAAERHRAQFLRGWINDRLGHFQQASAAFFQVRKLEAHPLRELAAFYEARADLRRGKLRTAISECDRYLREFVDGEMADECRLILADAHMGLGAYRLAIERYQQFLDEHPEDQRGEELRLKIAESLERAGDLQGALRAFRALYLNHRLPTTSLAAEQALRRLEASGVELPKLSDQELYVRACALRDSGEVESSYELYCDLEKRQAEGTDPEGALARRLADERHTFLWRNRRYEEVGEWNAAKYEAEPSEPAAAEHLYWAVQGLSRAGRFEEAVRYQEIGRKRFPSHRRFRSSYERSALLHVGAGNYRQAREAYQRWRGASSRARRSSKVRFFVAYYAYRGGLFAVAKEELEELTRRSSRYRVAARYYLGQTLRRLKQRGAAEEQFQAILKDHSDSWYALVLRSRERRRSGLQPDLKLRDGRWPGLRSGRERPAHAPLRTGSLQGALNRLIDAARPGLAAPLDPDESLGAPRRDTDGRLLVAPTSPWSSASLLMTDGRPAASQLPLLPNSADLVAADDVAGQPPPTWQASSLWDGAQGKQLWRDFVRANEPHWGGLATAYELSRVGLGELAGPLLSEIYNEVRKVRRKRSIKRKVSRWKASNGRRGGPEVARWAAILELGLDNGEWRDLFAAAGYPASVAHFANKATEYGKLSRADQDGRAAWTLLYPAAFAPHVWRAGWENNVDPLLMLSIMRAESLFRHDAVSRVGALGLVQVMPATGARVAALMGRDDFRVEKLLSPETNIGVGTWYMGQLLDRFAGQYPLAVGAYNGGPHNIGRWLRSKQGIPLEEFIEEIAFDETRNYIKKVMRFYSIYADIYGQGSAVQIPSATSQDDATVINF